MVTFVTLFLSLVTGVHPVQVAVDGPVARVEVLLDEEAVGTLTRAPWTVRCDFGPAIVPHELVAVAYDREGIELDRARQLVNLPRPRAETRVAFTSDEQGLPSAVRVFWEAAEPLEPLGVFVVFDGMFVQPDDDGLYPLPPYDPNQVHIISAEAHFLDDVNARTDLTFGGRYGSSVATELTAVPVLVEGRSPQVDELEGALQARGRPLSIAAVERPGIKLFMVRDQAAVPLMARFKRAQDRMRAPFRRLSSDRMSVELTREDNQLYYVVGSPTRRKGRELYPTSPGMDLHEFDLSWLVTHIADTDASEVRQRLAAATAVAGVQAAAEGSPRAVLLVLSDNPRDSSRHRPEDVRGYLRSLRVPLFVWSVGEEPSGEWGPVETIATRKDLNRAARDLERELERQWIVWVEGTHMINEIRLAEGARGVRLAGE